MIQLDVKLCYPISIYINEISQKLSLTQHGEDHKHTFCLPQLQTANSDTSVAQINMPKKCYGHEPQSSRAKLILPTIPVIPSSHP